MEKQSAISLLNPMISWAHGSLKFSRTWTTPVMLASLITPVHAPLHNPILNNVFAIIKTPIL